MVTEKFEEVLSFIMRNYVNPVPIYYMVHYLLDLVFMCTDVYCKLHILSQYFPILLSEDGFLCYTCISL